MVELLDKKKNPRTSIMNFLKW